MRYIADSDGYVKEVSFGAIITCGGSSCIEYTGAVPEGYTSLEDWCNACGGELYRWKIVGGNLTVDPSAEAPVEPSPPGIVGGVSSVNGVPPDSSGNVSLTASDVGAAAESHTHSAGNITSGTLASARLPTVPISKGGTGATSAAAALTKLGALAASAITVIYNEAVAFTSGKATYTNSAITASSVVFVERRVGSAGSSNVQAFGTTSNNGSVTICASFDSSVTINLNILIINL